MATESAQSIGGELEDLSSEDVITRVMIASNHFDCFGLPFETVEVSVVRKLYRRLALSTHPDKTAAQNASEAFMRLSEAFDVLGDEEKQAVYLQSLGGHRSKLHRSGAGDAASRGPHSDEFRHHHHAYKAKWWQNRSWKEIEEEIRRQDEAFKRDLEITQAKSEIRKRARQEQRRDQEAIIRANLAPLREKYGLDDDEDVDDASRVNVTGQTDRQASQPNRSSTSSSPSPSASANESRVVNAAAVPNSWLPSIGVDPNGYVCYLCHRKFTSFEHLSRHESLSSLHASNLRLQQQQRPQTEVSGSSSAAGTVAPTLHSDAS